MRSIIAPTNIPNQYTGIVVTAGELSYISNRIYPRIEMENACRALNEIINNIEPVFGSISQSDEIITGPFVTVISRISHQINKIECLPDNNVQVTLTILDTPEGLRVGQLIRNNISVYPRLIGVGILRDHNIVDQYKIHTVDLICE